MFNNAGIPGSNPSILDIEREDFKRVFDVNVYGAFLGAKHAAKVMIPARKGNILFTSSVASVIHGEVPQAYLASKHSVLGLTKNLCVELGRYGTSVSCISPYEVVTPMLRKALGDVEKEAVDEVASAAANLKEVKLEAEDVAEAVAFLGSDEPKYVNGRNLVVAGGYSTINPSFGEKFRKKFA